MEHVFLEDYFNSTTRIRRGRLFELDNRSDWSADMVSRHPHRDLQNAANSFPVDRAYKTATATIRAGREAVLGNNNAESHWIVVLSEKVGLDAYYLTLKAKTFLGVLPDVDTNAIPESNRQDILQALNAVAESASVQAPQPVIDACRNAASHMISAKFPESNPDGKRDLGKLVKWLSNQGRLKECTDAADSLLYLLEASSSYLVNQLHSRGKANAAAALQTRPLSPEDANLAVCAIAFLLQDFGWASNEG